jgi:beta-lactamase class A
MADVVAAETLASHPWTTKLQREMLALDSQYPARIGVYVLDLDTGVSASHRGDQRWYLASMVKVPVAIAVLRGIEQGRFTFETTVTLRASDYVDGTGATNSLPVGAYLSIRFLLEQMIIYSDNTAADVLIDLVGLPEINALVESLVPDGFQRITTLGEIRRMIYGTLVPNVERLSGKDLLLLRQATSDAERLRLLRELVKAPADFNRSARLDSAYDAYYTSGLNSGRLDAYGELLALLADGKVLTPVYTEYLLDLMERVTTGIHRIKAGLPTNVHFAHKTGTQRRRVCDAGVARWPQDGRQRRVLIVACTRDAPSLERAESMLKHVGLAVCNSGLMSNGVSSVFVCPAADAQPLRLPAVSPRR